VNAFLKVGKNQKALGIVELEDDLRTACRLTATENDVKKILSQIDFINIGKR
jgi:hypothetical protein